MGETKESILIDEIIRYLPSLSMGTKARLIKFITRSVCNDYCKTTDTCKDCPIGRSVCSAVEEYIN